MRRRRGREVGPRVSEITTVKTEDGARGETQIRRAARGDHRRVVQTQASGSRGILIHVDRAIAQLRGRTGVNRSGRIQRAPEDVDDARAERIFRARQNTRDLDCRQPVDRDWNRERIRVINRKGATAISHCENICHRRAESQGCKTGIRCAKLVQRRQRQDTSPAEAQDVVRRRLDIAGYGRVRRGTEIDGPVPRPGVPDRAEIDILRVSRAQRRHACDRIVHRAGIHLEGGTIRADESINQ